MCIEITNLLVGVRGEWVAFSIEERDLAVVEMGEKDQVDSSYKGWDLGEGSWGPELVGRGGRGFREEGFHMKCCIMGSRFITLESSAKTTQLMKCLVLIHFL